MPRVSITPLQQTTLWSPDQVPTYFEDNREDFIGYTIEHVLISLGSIGIAVVIGVGLAIATYRSPSRSAIVLAVLSVILTIPSFAMLAFFAGLPILGFSTKSIVVSLVLYALLPIVRNTTTGLRGVDSALLDSARGLGMSRTQILRRVELPLAWPVMIAGLRVATVLVVGIAAIAAYIQQVGLGSLIFDGLSRQGGAGALNLAIIGTVSVVIVAIALDALYVIVNRLTVSKGIRD